MTGDDRTDERVTVVVCTYRRPQIVETLSSIAEDSARYHLTLDYVVVDNDEFPTAEQTVRDHFARLGLTSYKYIHAPKQNISIARNAGLANCITRWAIMLDDDELVAEGCLAKLVEHIQGKNQVVFGRTRAIYPIGTAAWIVAADLHSNVIVRAPGAIDRGYTSLVLVDVEWIRAAGIHFDLNLGRSGGEDVMFFHQIYRAGGQLAYEPNAYVYEPVEPHRLKAGWYLRRRFRAGQVKSIIKRRFASPLSYLQFCGRCLGVATLSLPAAVVVAPFSLALAAHWAGRSAENFGALANAVGTPTYQKYA